MLVSSCLSKAYTAAPVASRILRDWESVRQAKKGRERRKKRMSQRATTFCAWPSRSMTSWTAPALRPCQAGHHAWRGGPRGTGQSPRGHARLPASGARAGTEGRTRGRRGTSEPARMGRLERSERVLRFDLVIRSEFAISEDTATIC